MNSIRLIRDRLKVNQFVFGEMAGVTQATVSRWETGHLSPSLDEMERIRQGAKALGKSVKPSDFFIAKPSSPAPEQRRAG